MASTVEGESIMRENHAVQVVRDRDRVKVRVKVRVEVDVTVKVSFRVRFLLDANHTMPCTENNTLTCYV